MKKLILIAIAVLTHNLSSFGGTSEDFFYDQSEVDQALTHLDELEKFVLAHDGITYAEVAHEQNTLVADISDIPVLAMTDDDPALGIPSFLWGCCLGVLGILVVYLVTENTEETKKALWGCLAASVAGCVFYLVYYVLILGYYGSYYYYF